MFLNKIDLQGNMSCRSNIAIQLIILFLLIICSSQVRASDKTTELVILNWSEYMDAEMIAAFEKKHRAMVKHIYFESDDHRDQILLQTGGKGFDLILANGIVIESYRKRKWIQPVSIDQVPNIKLIENRWKDSFKSAIGYGVPYFWGTLGIAYRKDLVSEPITSWKQLFNPSKELQGKILMVKSSRDIIGMALKSLGYSANSENIDELRQVEELLSSQKPHVFRFGYISLDETSSIVKGNIVAATVYGGDALVAAEHNKNIVYVLPEEGGNIWVDFFTIAAQSKHPELAAAFLDFINQPKWAAKNAEESYLATTNREAKKLLPAEFLQDSVIYPDSKLLIRSEFYKKLSPRSMRQRASIFARTVK